MTSGNPRFTLNLTHCYLEIARSSIVSLKLDHPNVDRLIEKHGCNPIINATISVVSVTIIYSYLAIESFVNYQLYRIWEKRDDTCQRSKRFRELFGEVDDFRKLARHKKARELSERIKTLCDLLNYKKPHEVNPILWQDFKELNEDSRHFIVHPYPEDQLFNKNLKRIGYKTPTDKYCNIAQQMLLHFHDQGGIKPPNWLKKNTLVRFTGVKFLWGEDQDSE